jgi:hypothetical protein
VDRDGISVEEKGGTVKGERLGLFDDEGRVDDELSLVLVGCEEGILDKCEGFILGILDKMLGATDGFDERLGAELRRNIDVGRLDTVGDDVEGLDEGADDASTLGIFEGFVLGLSEGLTDGYIMI